MIRLDKICTWTLIVCLAGMIWSGSLVKWLDELACYTLLAIGLLDCVVNHRWRVYRPLLLTLAVMSAYVVYSCFKPYNTLPYIVMDAIIELKPFVPLMVVVAIKPRITEGEKTILKGLTLLNTALVIALYFMTMFREYTLEMHIMYLGASCLVNMLVWIYCSIDDEGHVSRRDMAVALAMLAIGLGCTRAKYYGEAVVVVFFLLLYRPRMFHGAKPAHWLLAIAMVATVVAVSWNKISYYFITGNSDSLDPTVIESFARPVLYATGGLILISEIPLGSGLASFASYASQAHYSQLYHEYGISKIHGLSEDFGDFICDAFYPSLAQFGMVGVVLFVTYFVWAFAPVKRLLRESPSRYRYHYALAATIICFMLIECVASTLLMQSWGLLTMLLLAFITSNGKQAFLEQTSRQINE